MDNVIASFLERHRMLPEDTDKAVKRFVEEARRGLEGKSSSIAMIPSYIRLDSELKAGKPVIAIDAGGTNLRAALVTYTGSGWNIENEIRGKMPGTCGEITSDELFAAIAEMIEPFADRTDTIGFCFSYPAAILPELDGILGDFSKEVRVTGAAGKLIGAELKLALKRRGHDKNWRVAIVNDTVAAMLSGVSQGRAMGCDDFIGLILGTGMNMAYLEDCGAVTKDASLSKCGGRVCINTEVCSYTGFEQSDADIIIDGRSSKPGDHTLEKMVSGAYQGAIVREMLKMAADDGLIGHCADREISSAEVDAFCASLEGSDICLTEDRETVKALIHAFFDRAGFLMAVATAGILELSGRKGKTVCIVADGSVYFHSKLFRDSYQRFLDEIVEAKYGHKTVVIRSDYGNLAGAAASVLSC